ncbi:MAG: enoyl-CoA hydratase/isomerase family protein [Nitriliruptorales bacterium]
MTVSYDVEDRVAHITIQRPDKRNAMDESVFHGLRDAAVRAGEDADVRAVLVRGAGGHFSSGIDLNFLGSVLGEGSGGPAGDGGSIAELQHCFTVLEELDVPSVASISGVCFGAGLQLAAACHLRVVLPDASLSVMEVRWGLVPDLGGTYRLPRLIGLGRATELVATGRRIGADEARRFGFAERAVADEEEAVAFARELAAGPGSIARAIRLLRENLERPRETALEREAEAQVASMTGPDFAEAVGAHLEGRDPQFVGR